MQLTGHEGSAIESVIWAVSLSSTGLQVPVCRGPCVLVQAWSPLGPILREVLHESASTTGSPVAQSALFREHASRDPRINLLNAQAPHRPVTRAVTEVVRTSRRPQDVCALLCNFAEWVYAALVGL